MSEKNEADLNLCIELSGGVEVLFNNIKKHSVTLPGDKKPWLVKQLLVWLTENLVSERPDLFYKDETVRPGILVLINRTDWELMGELNYELKDGDNVFFISTLHGG